jgi:hypothetical protein
MSLKIRGVKAIYFFINKFNVDPKIIFRLTNNFFFFFFGPIKCRKLEEMHLQEGCSSKGNGKSMLEIRGGKTSEASCIASPSS